MRIRSLFLIIFILIITSCNQQLSNPYNLIEKIKPPLFSFLDKDPNNSNITYIKRMKKYDKIIKSSPIPIFVIKQNDLPRYLVNALNLELVPQTYGLYVTNTIDPSWPKEFIFINIESSSEMILTTFFHEFQHYKCKITQCYCSKPFLFPPDEQIIIRILKEKHAIENELKESLDMQDIYLVNNVFISITKYILFSNNCIYKMASLSVINGRIWEKANIFLLRLKKIKEKKFYSLLL